MADTWDSCTHGVQLGKPCSRCEEMDPAVRAAVQEAYEVRTQEAYEACIQDIRPLPRRSIMAVAEAMEAKLQQYEHKPGWKRDAWHDLFARLQDEEYELLEVLWQWDGLPSGVAAPELLAAILAEAADVANFLMMICDVVGALPPTDERGR